MLPTFMVNRCKFFRRQLSRSQISFSAEIQRVAIFRRLTGLSWLVQNVVVDIKSWEMLAAAHKVFSQNGVYTAISWSNHYFVSEIYWQDNGIFLTDYLEPSYQCCKAVDNAMVVMRLVERNCCKVDLKISESCTKVLFDHTWDIVFRIGLCITEKHILSKKKKKCRREHQQWSMG